MIRKLTKCLIGITTIIVFFANCGKLTKSENSKQMSVFQLHSGQTCEIEDKEGKLKVKINCEQISNFLGKDGKWCNKDKFIPHTGYFPKKEKTIKLCQDLITKDLSSKETIRFAVLGDVGVGQDPSKNYRQLQVSQAMQTVCEDSNDKQCDFAIFVGDLIYPSGVSDVWDWNFNHKFEDMYKGFENIDFFMIPGNHDYEGNIKAQLEYTFFSKKWRMLDEHYMIPKLPNWMIIQTINTEILSKNISMHETDFESKHCKNKGWNILAGHHPSHSNGSHGGEVGVEKALNSLNQKCKFDLYFSGHDHHLEHIQSSFDSFVLGGGGTHLKDVKTLPKTTTHSKLDHKNEPRQLFAKSTHGFTIIEATKSTLDIYIYDAHQWKYDDKNSIFLEKPTSKQFIYHCRKTGPLTPCVPQ